MEINDDMNIKIQRGSADGTTKNTGSSRDLAEYINHEDQERIDAGLEPLPFTTPEGDPVTTEEVIRMIDENARGLGKDDVKFLHMVVAPSQSEIMAMGETDKEVYQNALIFIKFLSNAYAQNFHRDGIVDCSDLVVFWKPHFTRGGNGDLQFHFHGIISRMSSGLRGKRKSISPLTNHRNTTQGPVQGGFDRVDLVRQAEKLFDPLFNYERQICETFDYRNTMVHGTAEQKAEQAQKMIQESAPTLEANIRAGIERRRKNLKDKAEIEEIAKALEKEGGMIMVPKKNTLSHAIEFADLKNKILEVFNNANNSRDLYYGLTALGITIKMNKSEDGIEDLIFEKLGRGVESKDIMSKEEHHVLLSHFQRLTGKELAEKVRERRAKAEAEKQIKQRPHGGPKFKR